MPQPDVSDLKDHRTRMKSTQLTSALHASREHLFGSIRGLTEEQFRFVPAGETWCIAAQLAHLLRIERAFAERARVALTEDAPRMESASALNDDDPGLAQHLAVPQIIHGMLNARRDLEDVIGRCDEATLARTLQHKRLGRMTIADVMTRMADHESEHAASIVKLGRQAPQSGRVILPLIPRS